MDAREVIARALEDVPEGAPISTRMMVDAILAALEAAGMAIVPVEATEAMVEAGYDADTEGGHFDGPTVYRAMIAAAKEPTDG